jgi:hypothetical protein
LLMWQSFSCVFSCNIICTTTLNLVWHSYHMGLHLLSPTLVYCDISCTYTLFLWHLLYHVVSQHQSPMYITYHSFLNFVQKIPFLLFLWKIHFSCDWNLDPYHTILRLPYLECLGMTSEPGNYLTNFYILSFQKTSPHLETTFKIPLYYSLDFQKSHLDVCRWQKHC